MCSCLQFGRPRRFMHADLDSFYASVEQRDDPSLRGQAGRGRRRGRARGELRSQGLRRSDRDVGQRGAAPVPEPDRGRPTFRRLHRGESSRVRHLPRHVARSSSRCRSTRRSSTSPGCGGSPDRRRRSPPNCAARVATEVGLPITIGIARTKFLAKVASAVGKPDGLLVVEPDEELAFLHPLPVQRLWGVGHVTATKLHDRGIHTVADVAAMSSAGADRDRRWCDGPPTPRAQPQPRCSARDRRQTPGVDRLAAGTRSAATVA